ncbi:MAG: NHL repeat-containing protein [Planctomycetota bacterium]
MVGNGITRRALLWATGGGALAVAAGCARLRDGPRPSLRVRYLASWGARGTDAEGTDGGGHGGGQLRGPIGIAMDDAGKLFVTDLHNARVQRFGPDGEPCGAIPLPADMATAYGTSASAGGIALDRAGLVYVALMASHKVVVLTRDGERVREWGRQGGGPGELDHPGGLAVGRDDLVYVCDQVNRRVQRFTRDGEWIDAWGSDGGEPGRFDGLEPASSRFGGPHYIALDGRGHAFTTEGARGRIQRLSLTGVPMAAWGSKDDGPGGFGSLETSVAQHTLGPLGIAVDARGRVWVSSFNGRVQAFSADGAYLGGFGRVGSGPGEFVTPHALLVDRDRCYVVDTGNHRVQVFAIDEP